MMFDLYSVVRKFSVKVAHNFIGSFFQCFFFYLACVCNDCHRKNQSLRSKMGLMSHLSGAYNAFSYSCFSFSSLLSQYEDVSDESDDEGSGSGFTSGLCVSSCFELSVDCVS